MKIINQTRSSVLADDTIIADTFFRRVRGLLGKNSLNQGQALILNPCNSIHTYFMRFPIDILFVDENNRVLQIITDLVPFRFSPLFFKSRLVIELPAGTIRSTATSQGDKLILE
ncbi:MAG: DUF192 domain-containing protein [Candidatus Omnitrophota bacterium]|jgi:hypothetical protein|nr:DUF192 domain-containing protein [Candidatus Omnitrophota bacterium]MDD5518787.1 DUF192 domain-containing protein [Candidatus Omnitrophota bacterium]